MKQLQITILFFFAAITVASAQRIEFEYNEFGECVVRRSPIIIENSSDIKHGEIVKHPAKIASYHPNPITDYLEIDFAKGSYKVTLADISGRKIRQYEDAAESGMSVYNAFVQANIGVCKVYITKKVSDRLSSIFKNDRKQFEEKWDDIKIFIDYGMLSDDTFYDKAKSFALLKDTEGKYYTYDEYQTLIKDNQTDKDGNLVYLYAQNKDDQYTYIDAAQAKGYNVLLMDGQLDPAMLGMLEQKLEKTRFTRVDGDVIDKLIVKEDTKKEELPEEQKKTLTETFKQALPTIEKTEFSVEAQPLGETAAPVIITQSEYMRRMKEMGRLQPGMAFYGEMPTMMNLVLNTDHPLIKQTLAEAKPEIVSQLIDLALLQNGMLKGEALTKFVKRSVELI